MKTKFAKLTLPKQSFYLLLVVLLLSIYNSSFAQQKNLIGIYGSGEWGSGVGLRNVSGLIYERKFTNHFGIETGALFHSLTVNRDWNSVQDPAKIRNLYLNVPILLKYYSNVVNIAGGPVFNTRLAEYRTGNLYKQVAPTSVDYPGISSIGYHFKVSKSLNIKDHFVLEPEVNLGNRFEFKKPSFGIGASFKYRF